MGKEQDWKSLGEEILDSVAGALNSGDFSQLNNLVSGTVDNVVREAKKQADFERNSREELLRQYQQDNAARREKWLQQQQELYRRREERREEWRKVRQAAYQNDQARMANSVVGGAAVRGTALPPPPRFIKVQFNRVGNVSNVLNTVFGAIGMGAGVAMSIVSFLLFMSGSSWFPFTLFTLAVLGISSSRLKQGSKQRGLLKRAQRYIQICGPKMYADVEEIAAQTGNSVKFVIKDIKKMFRKGMFPQGHLDRQETTLMLSDEVYRQYTETAQAFQMREQMEAEKQAREGRPLTPEEERQELERAQASELNSMMAEGMEYLQKLRELNSAIPGEEISSQLSKLEGLLKQIFDRVKEHPEQMNRMRKLMEYYLPTTVKLVEAYVGFEKVENPGQDILDAKAEIKKTLGIINEAFTELLNNLFQDEAFDATTDAQVLQAMLSREGLRKEMDVQTAMGGGASMGTVTEEETETEEKTETEEDEEDSPFKLSLEPEQPEGIALKAPWES